MSPEVERLLRASGVAFKIHRHVPVVSFEEATAALPFDPARMVKGLAFHLPDGRYAIVALRAAHRADYKKIADALGIRRADLRLGTASEIAVDLDMEAGGVVPVPVRNTVVLLDRAVLDDSVVFCGTGRSGSTMEIASADLVRVAGEDLGDFSKEKNQARG